MKKTITAILAIVMIFSFAACSKAPTKEPEAVEKPGDTMTLPEIIDSMTTDVDLPASEIMEINADNFESYLFVKPIDGAEAIAYEGMISAIAHSIVLLRVPDCTAIAAVDYEI